MHCAGARQCDAWSRLSRFRRRAAATRAEAARSDFLRDVIRDVCTFRIGSVVAYILQVHVVARPVMRRVGARARSVLGRTTLRPVAAPPGTAHATRAAWRPAGCTPRRLRSFMYTVCNLLRITQNRTRWPGAVPFDVRARRTKRAASAPRAPRGVRALVPRPAGKSAALHRATHVGRRTCPARCPTSRTVLPSPAQSRLVSRPPPNQSRTRTPATFGLADRRLGTRTHRAHTLCTHSAWHITRRPGNRPRLRPSTHR